MAVTKPHWREVNGKKVWVLADRPKELVKVRCRGCLRQIGVGHGHPMHKLFCSSVCAEDFPVLENTERDDVIEVLVRRNGWNAPKIAVNFEISRQRAQQILSERGLTAA